MYLSYLSWATLLLGGIVVLVGLGIMRYSPRLERMVPEYARPLVDLLEKKAIYDRETVIREYRLLGAALVLVGLVVVFLACRPPVASIGSTQVPTPTRLAAPAPGRN